MVRAAGTKFPVKSKSLMPREGKDDRKDIRVTLG